MKTQLDKTLEIRVGKPTREACPTCGALMTIRKNTINNTYFMGCMRYPDCRFTREIPETLILEFKGYKKLPGF